MIHFLSFFFRRAGLLLEHRWLTVMLFFLSMVAYSATGYMYFEWPANPELSWVDAFWWSIVTMTTVGYGDYFPVTTAGRVFVALPTMILGVSILGYVLSMLAGSILENKLMEAKGMLKLDLEDHIVICHYNGLGSMLQLVEEIRRDHATKSTSIVLVDEQLEEIPSELKEQDVHFVHGTPSNDKVLERASIANARYVLIQAIQRDSANSDNRNLLTVLTIEKLYPDVCTVVHCLDPHNVPFFERAGCDSVLCLSSLTNQVMVQEMLDPGVHGVVKELTSNTHGKQFYIVDLPSGMASVKDVGEMLEERKLLFLGLQRGLKTLLLPDPATPIEPNDKAVIVSNQRPQF